MRSNLSNHCSVNIRILEYNQTTFPAWKINVVLHVLLSITLWLKRSDKAWILEVNDANLTLGAWWLNYLSLERNIMYDYKNHNKFCQKIWGSPSSNNLETPSVPTLKVSYLCFTFTVYFLPDFHWFFTAPLSDCTRMSISCGCHTAGYLPCLVSIWRNSCLAPVQSHAASSV